MLWKIYNLLFPVVFLCLLPKYLLRMCRRGGYWRHFEQRIGHFGKYTKARLQEQRRIWVHAVSVGEMYVALRFIKEYRAVHPEAFFALSTNTSTGHSIAEREIDPRDVLFYFPVDFPPIIAKVLRIINPIRIILVEGEYWPNVIRMAHRREIPVSVINGRLSKSSYRGYRKVRPLTREILGMIDLFAMQSEDDADRLRRLGADPRKVHILGTVKFDVAERNPAGEKVAADVLRKIGIDGSNIVLLGGSTWPGEEAALCDIYLKLRNNHPRLFLVLVPRHVERADEIIQMLKERNITFVRRSRINQIDQIERPDVLFVDTTGELRNFYSTADIIFVGKSLTQHGGQNPIEPAMCGKAIVVGANMENFPAVIPAFLKADALVQVKNVQELENAIAELIADSRKRAKLGNNAAKLVEQNRGVLKRTVELLG